jgi:hypothetical protein
MDPSGLMGYMDPTQAYQQAALLQVSFLLKTRQKEHFFLTNRLPKNGLINF